MSSSEQAPEPTMDEILASIRKIISDDEPGESPQPEAAAPEPAAPAGDGLAEDLANALNDTPASAEQAEDILDLTQIVEDQPQTAEPQMEAPQDDTLEAALGDVAEAVAAPEPAPAPEVAQGAPDEAVGDVNIEALLAEAGVQDTVAETPAEPQSQVEENLGAILEQGDEAAAPVAEEAPISEALSALNPQAVETAAEAIPDAAMPESEPEAASQPEPAAEPAQEDASFEAAGDTVAEEPQAAEPAAAPEAPAEEAAGEALVEDTSALAAVIDEVAIEEGSVSVEEQAPAEAVEAAPASDGGKTLEDSVKDLLRPMLREWLDDNMERIVKDEVATGGLKSDDG